MKGWILLLPLVIKIFESLEIFTPKEVAFSFLFVFSVPDSQIDNIFDLFFSVKESGFSLH
jgi:hypothetical protein